MSYQTQQATMHRLECLRTLYKELHLTRILLEDEFAIVDDQEMVSADAREKWWKKLKQYRQREHQLATHIAELQRELQPLEVLKAVEVYSPSPI
jgi:hypothetical protein